MKITKKIIIDAQKLDILLRLNVPTDTIFGRITNSNTEPTGDNLIDAILDTFVIEKEFRNWGGNRKTPAETGVAKESKEKPNENPDFDNNHITQKPETQQENSKKTDLTPEQIEQNKLRAEKLIATTCNMTSPDADVRWDANTEHLKWNNAHLRNFVNQYDQYTKKRLLEWLTDNIPHDRAWNAQNFIKLMSKFASKDYQTELKRYINTQ